MAQFYSIKSGWNCATNGTHLDKTNGWTSIMGIIIALFPAKLSSFSNLKPKHRICHTHMWWALFFLRCGVPFPAFQLDFLRSLFNTLMRCELFIRAKKDNEFLWKFCRMKFVRSPTPETRPKGQNASRSSRIINVITAVKLTFSTRTK